MNDISKCTWTATNCEQWETSCGNEYEFYDDGPYENGFRYCPYCGKRIEEKPLTESYEDEP